MPTEPPTRLTLAPRLASWMAAGHPDQMRLAAYLDHASEVLAPAASTEGELAARLDVGLGPAVDLLDQRDLDNYLFPLAMRVRRTLGDRVVSWWATKSAQDFSTLRIAPATPTTARIASDFVTSASAESSAFKHEVRNGVLALEALPEGPVALEIAFVVGSTRNWLNLWKATIDALDPLLGTTARLWHPRDGRIVRLGLHRRVDRALRHQVRIALSTHG